ncbi:MAG: triose-phosphate isomerase [Alphaproteobacteria bacterium]|nr:MAG: triose-phosphate isomerase [Alphaproteobacteria bacterium]
MSGMGPWLVANWKMNGRIGDLEAWSRIRLDQLNTGIGRVVVCPPALLLHPLATALADTGLELGAQDCHAQASGAYTGNVSAEQLAEAGAQMVIVGHSERRGPHRETDAVVREKATAALRARLEPIVCVGETLSEREGGLTKAVVAAQATGSLPLGCEQATIAYEPVWAIGSGRIPQADDIARAVAAIRDAVHTAGTALRVLYGGSVSAETISDLLRIEGVDGVLVGGAALSPEGLSGLLKAAPYGSKEPSSLDSVLGAA